MHPVEKIHPWLNFRRSYESDESSDGKDDDMNEKVNDDENCVRRDDDSALLKM